MEVYEAESDFEKKLTAIADANFLPLGGGMELLPNCNMQCRMCFIHKAGSNTAKLLRAADWLRIAEQMQKAGVLFLLLTGGEPLLHPDFKEIYLALRKMGFVLTVNSNGTLINEAWADFFAENPCRRLNITLYGGSNETYAALCGNPNGFAQITRAIRLLKERSVNMRLNMTLTRENRNDLEKMVLLARQFDLPFVPATYMYPPRDAESLARFSASRMSPREAAETRLKATFLRNPDAVPSEQAKLLLDSILGPVGFVSFNKGFHCRAARSSFWINWEGYLSPCTMIDSPKEYLREKPFEPAWKDMVQAVHRLSQCQACSTCRKRIFCQSCAAACLAETGSFCDKPQYLCDVTDEMIRILLGCLEPPDAEKYTELADKYFFLNRK